jgi:hypothetical protein
MQIKEAFEIFERKYNPTKYTSIRSKNEHEDVENENKKDNEREENESIRDKYKKNQTNTNFADNKSEDDNNTETSEKGFSYKKGDSEDYFKQEQAFLEAKQEEYIKEFLKNKLPNPRSEKMIDRLNLKSETIGRGKYFGADDWFSFLLVTFVIWYFLYNKSYKMSVKTFEDLRKVNIYNIFKDDSYRKDIEYKSNEKSPLESSLSKNKDFKEYEINRMKEINEMLKKENIKDFRLKEIQKVDLKAKFNQELE